MIWIVTIGLIGLFVLTYLVRLLKARLLVAAEVSAGQLAEEASNLRDLTNKALSSRPTQRSVKKS